MKFIKIQLLIIFLFCIQSISAQVGLDKLAQSTMNFLLVSTSPKASAMGDAYFVVGKGADAMFYNPAAIVETNGAFDIAVNYTQWIADINYLSGGVAYKMDGNLGTIGISILTVDYGTINGTSLISEAQQADYPAGYIDNGPVSNVGAYAVGISYGRKINQQFSIGGNIKIAGQNLGENVYTTGTKTSNDATKLVFDAGVKYDTGYKGFSFGMAIRNFASQVKREEIDEQLPLTFTMGAAVSLLDLVAREFKDGHDLTLAVDYLHSNNYSERINMGMEYIFKNMVAVRGGYQTNRDLASFSGGIGLVKQFGDYGIELNYSFSKMDIFDNVNRLSLGFTF